CRAVHDRAGRDVGQRHAADPHADALEARETALQHQQVAPRRDGAIADVEVADALDRKLAGIWSAEQEAVNVALAIKRALGNPDQRTAKRQAAWHEVETFQPLVVRQPLNAWRHG